MRAMVGARVWEVAQEGVEEAERASQRVQAADRVRGRGLALRALRALRALVGQGGWMRETEKAERERRDSEREREREREGETRRSLGRSQDSCKACD